MGIEIERKFLVDPSKLPHLEAGTLIQQAYFSSGPWVRVRLAGFRGELTIKGSGTLVRPEFNYTIPADDAIALLKMADRCIKKRRYYVRVGEHLWEVDQFLDQLDGLWLAEVELDSTADVVEAPAWTTREVTEDIRYSNVQLLEHGIPQDP